MKVTRPPEPCSLFQTLRPTHGARARAHGATPTPAGAGPPQARAPARRRPLPVGPTWRSRPGRGAASPAAAPPGAARTPAAAAPAGRVSAGCCPAPLRPAPAPCSARTHAGEDEGALGQGPHRHPGAVQSPEVLEERGVSVWGQHRGQELHVWGRQRPAWAGASARP